MHYYQRLKALMLTLVVCIGAKAQIENGKIYNFANVGNNGKSLAISTNNYISIAPTNSEQYAQLWYAEGDNSNGYTLRNLGNGRYLRSSNGMSVKWTMVQEADANCKFKCTTVDNNYSLLATNTKEDYHHMHYAASQDGHIVGWTKSANASQWTITPVDGISNEELNANWDKLSKIDPPASVATQYQTALNNLFEDKACTKLKKSFASENDVKNDADYNTLPATLQEMVLKIYHNNWEESNYDNNKENWDNGYANKYRVQLYEPYNEPEAAAKALCINAHTNLNNPTGIFANADQTIYVMVEGAIEDGAALYLSSFNGNGNLGGYAEGIELHEGLNIIPSFMDGNNYCINYVVHTFDTSNNKRGTKAKARKLSDYDDLKIHIEGGYINGYYNKMGDELYTADKSTDWEYIEARATQTTVTVLGKYVTLQFPLNDMGETKGLGSYFNEKINIEASIDEWDNIMMWERLLLGVLDQETTEAEAKKSPYSNEDHVISYTGGDAKGYADYYNVHGLSLGVPSGNPYGSWNHCGYPYGGMQSIMADVVTNAGAHWTAAHEMGHQHQSMMLMRGETEVTNNLFSNVVLWFFGESTSRYNGTDGALSNVLANLNNGGHYLTNNIWGMTQMYYKLFLYYHVLGHNTQFYPQLFEMLRQEPMDGKGGTVDGAKAQLHLYKMVCRAAGEDLTEFFRAHGFFVPLNGFSIDDYSVSTFNMTQNQIDAAIAEIKKLGYKENIAVLFINDATGETITSHKEGNLELYNETKVCAEVGSYASFYDAASDYIYATTGNTVTMKGTGGVGFAIYNKEGNLIAFSDKKTFIVSDEVAAAIASDEVDFAVVNGNNTVCVPVHAMNADSEAKYEFLVELLTTVKTVTDFIDETDKNKPGYYKGSLSTELVEAYNQALEVHTNKSAESYSAAYDLLNQAYNDFISYTQNTVPILAGSTYVLTNVKYPTKSMTGDLKCAATDVQTNAQHWVLEAADANDTYYIKNVSKNIYLGSMSQSVSPQTTTDKAEAKTYKAFNLGEGKWAFQCQDNNKLSLHCDASSNIVGWYHTASDNDGSWWKLTAVSVNENNEASYKLQSLVEQAEALISEVTAEGNATELSATLAEVTGAITTAQGVLSASSTTEALNSAYGTLKTKYDALLNARNQANENALNAKKQELRALITSATSLFNSLGEVTPHAEERMALTLQTTQANGAYYLSSNADQNVVGNQTDGDGIAALIDGKPETYMHTQWSGEAVNDDHYIQVALTEGHELSTFAFTYNTRKKDPYYTSPAPTIIEVYGSIDGNTFKKLTTFTSSDASNALPTYEQIGAQWTSRPIKTEKPYKYLRFYVRGSKGPAGNQHGGHYYFAMSEFGLLKITPAYYEGEASVNNPYVTEALPLAYETIESAEGTMEFATSIAQVENAIKRLQAQYDALNTAMNHKLNISNYGYAGLYLPYNAEIPEGVAAYIATSATSSAIALQALTGNVIPANTAVIIEASKGDYTFSYTDSQASELADNNLLKGSAYTIYEKANTGYNYYVLGVKNDEVGMYKARMNYTDENGCEASGEDLGDHFKVSANKIYFEWNQANGAPMLRITRNETGISSILNAQPSTSVTYDLTGRRVEKTGKGIYIVNGEKVVIK